MTLITYDSTGNNPIIRLAKETETPLHLWKENALLVDRQGHVVDAAEANKILKQVWEVLERATEHSTDHSQSISPDKSLYSFFKDHCDQALQSEMMSQHERDLVLGMSEMWGAYVGDRVERQSLRYFFLEDCIEGGKRSNLIVSELSNCSR